MICQWNAYILVCIKTEQRGLRQIFSNLLFSREVGRNFTWVTARSFTDFLKTSSHCLCVFTLRFCSSESRQERICWALCLYCLFPVRLFGSLWGKRHCSQRPIKHKHRTMDDGRMDGGGFAPQTQFWGICVEYPPRTTQQDIMSQLSIYSTYILYIHSEDKSLPQILPSDFI